MGEGHNLRTRRSDCNSSRFNIAAHASIRFLGATAVGSAEVSSGRRTEQGGVEPARSAPLKEWAGVRDTLKIPDVVTRFLAAEVCPATTRLRRPGRTGAGACRPAHASAAGHQLGDPAAARPARRSRRGAPIRAASRRLRRALRRLHAGAHHQHAQSSAADVAGAGDRRAPPGDPHRTLRRPVRQAALRQPGNPRRRQPAFLSRR